MTAWKIAHRGASGHAPENTLAAMLKALSLGADGIELDVHLSKDGVPVVIHDETLERTTNGHGKVSEHTLAALQHFDAGNGERIPTLQEVIELVNGNAILFIEIKDPQAAAAVVDTIAPFAATLGYCYFPIISFNWDALLHVKTYDPKVLIGATPPEDHIPDGFLEEAKAAGMWSVNPCIGLLDNALVEKAKSYGLKLITWTVNNPRDLAIAHSCVVDGIISDYPDRL